MLNTVAHIYRYLLPGLETKIPLLQDDLVFMIIHEFDQMRDMIRTSCKSMFVLIHMHLTGTRMPDSTASFISSL